MIRRLPLAFGLIFAACAAVAQTGLSIGTGSFDTNQPVEVSANELAVDQQAGTAEFIGNVVVVQGDLRMAADRVQVVYATDDAANPNGISRLIASGGVTFVTPTEAAEAQEAVYTIASGDIVMSGDVLLTQGQNTLAGEQLVVDLASGTGRMEGRVRTVFGASAGDE